MELDLAEQGSSLSQTVQAPDSAASLPLPEDSSCLEQELLPIPLNAPQEMDAKPTTSADRSAKSKPASSAAKAGPKDKNADPTITAYSPITSGVEQQSHVVIAATCTPLSDQADKSTPVKDSKGTLEAGANANRVRPRLMFAGAPEQVDTKSAAPGTVSSVALQLDSDTQKHREVDQEDTTKPVIVSHVEQRATAVSVADPVPAFRPSLFVDRSHSETIAFQDEDAFVTDVPMPAASLAPLKRLDLQWNDTAFGKIAVTAEIRDGTVHATLHSERTVSDASVSGLHEFLESNRVGASELQVSVVGSAAHSSRTLSSNETTSDRAPLAGGDSQSSPRGGQEQPPSRRQYDDRWDVANKRSKQLRSDPVEDYSAVHRPQSQQHLSIHI